MCKFFVYLDLKHNRLVIVNEAIKNSDFLLLMDNNGMDSDTLHSFCKVFCIGYIMGSKNKTPINNINEFQ